MRVVVNASDAVLEHFYGAPKYTNVMEMPVRWLCAPIAVEHEHGERYIQIHATHQIASRVEVSVDKTRHGEEPFGIDNTQIPLAFRRTDIRFNCLDL